MQGKTESAQSSFYNNVLFGFNSHFGCRIFNNKRSAYAVSISDADRRARPPIVAILELTDSAAVQCLGSDLQCVII